MPLAWVVEDNEANFELVEFLLVEAGWCVIRAADRAGFRTLLGGESPDLVLLDMHLPDASGLDLLGELRATPGLERTLVLALTAHAMRGDREKFLRAGCDGYISKPITASAFVTEIEAALAQRPG